MHPAPSHPRTLRPFAPGPAILWLFLLSFAIPSVGFSQTVSWADVEPIVATSCAACHHPGGPGPFSLLTFEDAAPRASAIATAVERGIMPPWKPVPGFGGPFVNEHRLSTATKDILRRWADAGAPAFAEATAGQAQAASAPSHLSHHSSADGSWTLGTPDLVITLPVPFALPPGTSDVFRNFAVPVPLEVARYVKGIEFQPTNHVVTHHANIRVDPTAGSLRLDARDPEPGYAGIAAPTAAFPDGYFLGWTPGQIAPFLPDGLGWKLPARSSLAVELHLVPSNRVEVVNFRVGLYFTDVRPTRTPVMLRLGRQDIDIPPGESHHVVRDDYRLPVDVDVQSVQPHAHQRARSVKGYATLPDGTRRWLISIDKWDFHAQDVYRYATPVSLPRNSTIHMEWVYDNSAQNRHNPVLPPERVEWGQYTRDEMGDLWLQVMTRGAADAATLTTSIRAKELADDLVGFRTLLRRNPGNTIVRANLADGLVRQGKITEGLEHLRAHVKLEPDSATAHYNLATILSRTGSSDEAIVEFRRALALDPSDVFAHNGLGTTLLARRDFEGALAEFAEALRIDPQYASGYSNVGIVLNEMDRPAEALAAFRRAIEVAPDDVDAHFNAARLLETRGRPADAEPYYREALALAPADSAIRRRLSQLLRQLGRRADADVVEQQREK